MIEIMSLILLILILILSWNKKGLPLLFPVLLLIYPNSVDNILPGFYLNYPFIAFSEPQQIFRFLDIVLILISFRLNITFKNDIKKSILLLLFYLFFLILPLILGYHKHIFSIFFVLITLFRITIIYNIVKHLYYNSVQIKKMFLGLSIGIALVILEALLYTYIYDAARLTSGNYANNTLGAIISVILTILLIAKLENYLNYKYYFVLLFLFCFLIITGARAGIFSLFIVIIIYFISNKKLFSIIFKGIPLFLFTIIIGISVIKFFPEIGDKFVFGRIPSIQTMKNLSVERWSEYGILDSFFYRLYLWKATIIMTVDNWLFGVGYNAWDYERWHYGITEKSRLDPHNTFFQLISEFGLIIGLFIIIKILKQIFISRNYEVPLYFLHFGLLVFVITQLTNNSILRLNFLMIMIFLFSFVFNKNLCYKFELKIQKHYK